MSTSRGGGLGNHLQGLQLWARSCGGKKKTNFDFMDFKEKWDPFLPQRCAGGVHLHPEMVICWV